MKYHPTQQTLSWFKARNEEGSLVLRPPYQRRPVWTNRQKSHLIETILLKLPIPEIYVHVTIDDSGSSQYAVVDGQQRIRAILQFVGADREESEAEYDKFALEHLDANAEFYDWTFEDLSPDQRRDFYSYSLAVRELTEANEDDVRRVFARLNKYLTKLSPQELRNAIYSGPFTKLADDLTNDEFWAENRIVSAATIRRMGDIEFVSELLIGVLDGPQSGKADVIDEYYKRFEDCNTEFPGQPEARKRFSRSLALIQELFPDLKDTRWRNKTDFYSLFLAFAHMLRDRVVPESNYPTLQNLLNDFADQVEKVIESPNTRVPANVSIYAQAHVKGSTEKSRRAARHESLLNVIQGQFQVRKSSVRARRTGRP
jgi:hypothetical protein